MYSRNKRRSRLIVKDFENYPKFYIRGQIAPPANLFSLFGDPEETVSAKDLVKFLDNNKDAEGYVFEISSDGGYKSEGVEMYQIIKNIDKPTVCIIYKANSIATVVMLGAKTRLIAETAPFVIHFARIDPINLGMDPLTAEDFQKLAEEVERSDKQILDIYCSELGEEKRTELLAMMGDERDLGAKGAVKLGFATGFYKKKKKEKPTKDDFRGVLITDEIESIIKNNMEKTETQKKLEGMESSISGLKKLFAKMFSSGKTKNEVLNTDKGPVDFAPVNPDDPANLVGAKVYKVDADGLPTADAADDGEYKLDDGRVAVVAAGAVTEVKEAIDAKKLQEDLNAEKEKNKGLETEIANLKAERDTAKTEMQAQLTKIQNEFAELKKQVRGDKKEKSEDVGEDEKEPDFSKMSRADILKYQRKQAKFQ